MGVEIEAKLRVERLADVEQRLRASGGEFLYQEDQSDHYYEDPIRGLVGRDHALRIRHQHRADATKACVTYKGPRQPDDFKKRKELETEVADPACLAEILVCLGFQEVRVVEKTRRLWRMGPCLVALDQVAGLGTFVEIEGPDSPAIRQVQADLGLAHLTHIQESYARMLAQRTCT